MIPPASTTEKRDLNSRQLVQPLDSVFILDCSRSMGDTLESTSKSSKLDISKSVLVSSFSRAAEGNCPDRICLLTVSTNILAKPMIHEVMELRAISPQKDGEQATVPIENIAEIKSQGGTALYAAISRATRILVANRRGRNIRQQIVVITDSKNNTAEQPMKTLAEAAKNQVKIHVIDLGNPKVSENLKMICDATGGQFVLANSARDLQAGLSGLFTIPMSSQNDGSHFGEGARPQILLPGMFRDMRPPVTPKRKRAESVEEIGRNIAEIRRELEMITESLKNGKMTQMKFTERYCVLQFDLQELRQSIREQRSRLNREMSEYALVKNNTPSDSRTNKETSERLLDLDKQVQLLKQSAAFAS